MGHYGFVLECGQQRREDVENNPYEVLGWTDEKAAEVAEAITKPAVAKKDVRVCICGHPARAHATQGLDKQLALEYTRRGHEQCKYARMTCPCTKFNEIGTCESTQSFTFKTAGADQDHALVKGMQKARGKGAEFEWTHLEKTVCAKCGKADGERHLVSVTSFGEVVNFPEKFNMFLCQEHFIEMGGARL
jgi:hypothetical protein